MSRSLMLLILLTACAPNPHRGSIVMKIDDEQAHVGLGGDQVAAGDRVRIFRVDCSLARNPIHCQRMMIAEGTVTEILGNDYSVVRFPAGTFFAEGDVVERAPR